MCFERAQELCLLKKNLHSLPLLTLLVFLGSRHDTMKLVSVQHCQSTKITTPRQRLNPGLPTKSVFSDTHNPLSCSSCRFIGNVFHRKTKDILITTTRFKETPFHKSVCGERDSVTAQSWQTFASLLEYRLFHWQSVRTWSSTDFCQ